MFSQNASYEYSDTRVMISRSDSYLTQMNMPYFQINWYEGNTQNGEIFGNSDWKPYSPRFKQAYEDIPIKDTYHRIQQVYNDGLATGIILYNSIYNAFDQVMVEKIVSSFNMEFYLRTYDMRNKHIYPLSEYPLPFEKYKDNNRVHWYFNDDIDQKYWTEDNVEIAYDFLNQVNSTKYFFSACGMFNYLGKHEFLLNYVDIIAPQIYPVKRKFDKKTNIINNIPPFYNHTRFHKESLNGKKLVIEYNKANNRHIYYLNTLATYHRNDPIGKTISRFPTYEEFRYQFYDAIICGAKGINIYCFYRSDYQSYENAKRIITEFRKSGFENALLFGYYKPEIVNYKYLKINNDIDDEYGKDLYDIDFCLYEGSECFHLIVSNNANLTNNVCFELIQESIGYLEEVYMDEKMMIKKIKLPFKENFFFLNFAPYEVKLIKIFRKT